MKQQNLDLQTPYLLEGFLKQGELMGLKRWELAEILKTAASCSGGSCPAGIASRQGMVGKSFNSQMTPVKQGAGSQGNFTASSPGENAQMQQKLKQMSSVPKPGDQDPLTTQAGREVFTSEGRLIYPSGGGDPYFVKGFQPVSQAGGNNISTVNRPKAPYIPLNPQQTPQMAGQAPAQARPAVNPAQAQPPANITSQGSGNYQKLRGWLPPQMEQHLDRVGWGTPQAAKMIQSHMQKNPTLQKRAEESYLQYAREKLFKLGAEHNIDAKDYILEVTNSPEAFEKAAALEAHRVFHGFVDSMKEHGANSDFVQGFMKEAQDNGFKPMDLSKPMTNTMGGGTELGLSTGTSTPNVAPLGGQLGTPVSLSTPASAPQTQQAKPEQNQPAQQSNHEPIANTMPRFNDPPEKESRHEIIPGFNNKWTGGLGGLLLGSFIGNEMGLDGPMGMLLPLLGAGAGYHYLPKLMNQWKDPAGTGANALHPAVRNVNQQFSYNL